MAIHLARPMVTYRALDLGASPLEIGLVQSAYSILPVIMAITVGQWVDRYGEPRVITLGCCSLAGGGLVLILATELWALGLGQALLGFGLISQGISSQAWIANRSPANRRVHWFGWFAASLSIGQILGPAVGAAIADGFELGGTSAEADGMSSAAPFVASVLISLAALGLALLVQRRTEHETVNPGQKPPIWTAIGRVLRRPGIAPAIYVSLSVASVLDVLLAYLPAYGEAVGLSVATVGTLLSVRAGASLISRAVMGPLNDWLGLRKLLFVTTGTAALAIAVVPLVDGMLGLYLAMVIVGFGLGIGQPISIAWIANRTPAEERGLALGIRLTGNFAAVLVVPIIMGAIAAIRGYGAIWGVLAVFLGVAAAMSWLTRSLAEPQEFNTPEVT